MDSVTILLPTYESNPAHLRAAVESALAQTFADWELFIHDDASTKDIRTMVEPYLKDPRVHFERSPRRLGIGGNWNASLRLGSAPLVQFLFQDDEWNTRYLERAVAAMHAHPDIGFVAVNHEYRSDPPGPMHPIYAEVTGLRKKLLQDGRQDRMRFLRWWIGNLLRPNVIGEPSFVLLRRDAIREAGPFREDLKQYLDAEYWLRLLLQHDFSSIAEPLGFFRVHSEGASSKNRNTATMLDRPRILLALLLRHPLLVLRSLTRL